MNVAFCAGFSDAGLQRLIGARPLPVATSKEIQELIAEFNRVWRDRVTRPGKSST
jgi:hypothetical protein